MTENFNLSDEVTKVTRLADNASRKGMVVGLDSLRADLECELQRLSPAERLATFNAMKGQGHFASIDPFKGKDGDFNALWFTQKDGSAVVAQLRDPITDEKGDSCPAAFSS